MSELSPEVLAAFGLAPAMAKAEAVAPQPEVQLSPEVLAAFGLTEPAAVDESLPIEQQTEVPPVEQQPPMQPIPGVPTGGFNFGIPNYDAQAARKTMVEKIEDIFTGEQRTTDQLEMLGDWTSIPELQEFSWGNVLPSLRTALGTTFDTSQKNIAQVIKANYPQLEYDEDSKGNPMFKSPTTGKWYAAGKPGYRASDIPSTIATTVGSVALPNAIGTAASRLVGPATGKVAKFSSPFLREGAGEVAMQATKELGGGEGSYVVDPLIAGVGGKIGESLEGAIRSGVAQRGLDDMILGANKGNVEDIAQLAQRHAESPEIVDAALAERYMEMTPSGEVKFTGQVEQIAQDIVDGKAADMTALRHALENNPRLVRDLEDLGIADLVRTNALVNREAGADNFGKRIVDAVATTGMTAESIENLKVVANRVGALLDDVAGNPDIGASSKKMRSIMLMKRNLMENTANREYSELAQIDGLMDLPAEAKSTQDMLLTKIDSKRSGVKEGFEEYDMPDEISGYQPAALTPVQKRVLSRVYTRKIKEVDPDFEVDPAFLTGDLGAKQKDPILDRELATYRDLDEARKEVGKAMKNEMFSDEDAADLATLYGRLAEDQLSVIRANADKLPEGTLQKMLDAKALVSQRKAVEDNMRGLFGKALKNDINDGAFKSAAKKTMTSKFESILSQLPENQQGVFFRDSLSNLLNNGMDGFSVEHMASLHDKMQSQGFKKLMNKHLGNSGAELIDKMGRVMKDVLDPIKNPYTDANKDYLEKVFAGERGILKSLLEKAVPLSVVGVSATAAGGATSPVMRTLQQQAAGNAYWSLNNAMKKVGRKRVDILIDMIDSNEFKTLMMSPLEDADFKRFSNTKKMRVIFKRAGLADTPAQIESYLNLYRRELEKTEDGN